jgi:hypothetical protein
VGALAFAPAGGPVPSVAASLAAFNTFVRPLERAQRTRSKAVTHRQSLPTWAIWKGVLLLLVPVLLPIWKRALPVLLPIWKRALPVLLPMSDDLVRAYIGDCRAFEGRIEASLSVLKHALDAIKGWRSHLELSVPLDGPGDYRCITTSFKLSRFQPTHRIPKFPIHKNAVRRLLSLPLPPHPPCAGVPPPKPARPGWRRCPICWAVLHRWFDCLAGATATLLCSRCLELGQLQTCDIWWQFDFLRGGWLRFKDGAAYNTKIRKK